MVIFKISKKLKKQERLIKKYLEEAIEKLRIKNYIKSISVTLSKKLKDDIEVDYKNIKKGYVKIKIGNKCKLNRKIIYHEMGHVYDAIYNNIFVYSLKLSRKQNLLCGLILNLSLDGRLEKMKLPHISKRERFLDLTRFMKIWNKKYKEKFTRKELVRIFENFWGKKIRSSEELLEIYEKIIKSKNQK
jgi:hypothetical protein